MSVHKNCSNCAHYGCCDSPCGGTFWKPDSPKTEWTATDPYDGWDEQDQWEHDAELYQELMDRKY